MINQSTPQEPVKKEFLRIEDMLKKFSCSRKQFWRLRKNGDIPEPVIKSPPMWLAKTVDDFYLKRARTQAEAS